MTADREPSGPEPEETVDMSWKDYLFITANGVVQKNLFNACLALREHPYIAGRIAYNEFDGCTWVRGPLPWDERVNRVWTEFDDLAAAEWMQSREVGVLVGSAIAREAVQRVAYEQRFHPVLDWLEGLTWDGKERLSGWLATYLGVTDSKLARAVGRKFLISAVARVYKPGCKVDHALILEGQQGAMKSKTLRALVGDEWFTDEIADLGTKDSCQDLRGKWIVELSELSAIRPGEVEKVKAFFSRQVDHYRPSYGRRSIDVPRQTVFIGTTNTREYLSDSTGGRRFWPMTCGRIDPDALHHDREQLWAEAVAAFHTGEAWWLEDEELRLAVQEEQEARRIKDPWEAIIAAWLANPTRILPSGAPDTFKLDNGCVTVAQLLEHAIAKPAAQQTAHDTMRVGKVLTLLSWVKHHTRAGNVWSPSPVNTSGPDVNTPDSSGVHTETRGNGQSQAPVNTVNTYSAHTHERDYPHCSAIGNQASRYSPIHAEPEDPPPWPDEPPLPDDDEHADWLRS